ncbi:DUF6578 domain-containing protein [Streptomyces sp. NPDC005931]|uniref:DUF6578 domain-containing protein n=1 Tax=Streptomyces sp. NPDC005931 TaxID=3364737 RepID=UPI0036A12511
MGLWHVFYDNWQMECCGEPFAVGDEVSWPLLLSGADDVLGGGWRDQLTKITGPVEALTDGVGVMRLVRDEYGPTVALSGGSCDDEPGEWDEVGPGGRIRAVGLLKVEQHSGAWPETEGRVRAVQLLTQVFTETAPGSRAFEPVARERSLRPVERCPKWFADRRDTPGPDGRARRRVDSAAVVTLEVPGTDSWLSHAVREARGIPHQGARPGAETADLPPADLTALLETLSTTRPGPPLRNGPAGHRRTRQDPR